MNQRPAHLPDFTDPPLDEVVLGIQFASSKNFTSMDARDVWDLFRDRYPLVREQPALEPRFETFGHSDPVGEIQIRVDTGPVRSRMLFLSEAETHLLQFQFDRFLMNWRKRSDDQMYPRFERIAQEYLRCVSLVEEYFRSENSFEINQAEVAYINIISAEDFAYADRWFAPFRKLKFPVESMDASLVEVIELDGHPCARLFHHAQTVVSADRKHKAFRFSLTFRGTPKGGAVTDVMEFFERGREKIVLRFRELTTKNAHLKWGLKT